MKRVVLSPGGPGRVPAVMRPRAGASGDVRIERLDAEAAVALHDAVLGVWTETFGPVSDPASWTETVWERHRGRADYRLVVAFEGAVMLGFAWGCTGERGQFFSDLLVERLGSAADDWVGGHFELVELAVIPAARAQGLGRALHDALLADLPHPRALLCTAVDPTDPAVRLYTSRGWQRVGLLRSDTQVMGLEHPAQAVSTRSPADDPDAADPARADPDRQDTDPADGTV